MEPTVLGSLSAWLTVCACPAPPNTSSDNAIASSALSYPDTGHPLIGTAPLRKRIIGYLVSAVWAARRRFGHFFSRQTSPRLRYCHGRPGAGLAWPRLAPSHERRYRTGAIIWRFGAWRSPVSALVWGTRGRGFKSRRSDHFATACRSPLRFLQRPIKKRPRLYQIIEHALQFLAVLGARAIH